MSPMRREADGTLQIGPTWESLVERQIREAMEAGAFDDLPFQGRRLPLEDDSAAGDQAVGQLILRRAGVAPAWIETDREIRTLLERRERLFARAARSSPLGRARDREELTAIVRAIERLTFRLELEAPTPAQHRRPLDLATELERLARLHAGVTDAGASAAPRPEPR